MCVGLGLQISAESHFQMWAFHPGVSFSSNYIYVICYCNCNTFFACFTNPLMSYFDYVVFRDSLFFNAAQTVNYY